MKRSITSEKRHADPSSWRISAIHLLDEWLRPLSQALVSLCLVLEQVSSYFVCVIWVIYIINWLLLDFVD